MFFTDVLASRLVAAGIQPVPAVHRNREVILLNFDAGHTDLATLVKGSGGCWSQAHRCWYVPLAVLNQGSLLAKLGYPLPGHLQAEVRRYAETLEMNAYSKATIRNYTACLLPFLFHFREVSQVSELPDAQIQEYLSGLLHKGGLAESTVNMHLNAIKIFYEAVCGRSREYFDVLRPKKRVQHIMVFSRDEVYRIISSIPNLKHRAMVIITYATGLRLSEAVDLRLKDINSERMVLHIHQSKNKKDREVTLSESLLEVLRIFDSRYKPKYFLFEGQEGGPYCTRRLQQIMHDAKAQSGIRHQGSINAIRHSFVAHFLEDGTDMRFIVELLRPNS